MRVIGGEFRSRRLKTLPGLALRPTPDRLREALFNVLAPRIADSVFLDAYAGSGAVGIEALSRGAARAIFVEKHFSAARVIRENLRSLGIEDRATVVQGAAGPALARLGKRAMGCRVGWHGRLREIFESGARSGLPRPRFHRARRTELHALRDGAQRFR